MHPFHLVPHINKRHLSNIVPNEADQNEISSWTHI